MIKVTICIGSSCHIKGSYDIIEAFQSSARLHGVTDKVEVSASFCLNNCSCGVNVKVNDKKFENISVDDVEKLMEEHILCQC